MASRKGTAERADGWTDVTHGDHLVRRRRSGV